MANLTDGQILTMIRAKLARSKVGPERFQVSVVNGVATFEGHTTVPQHKGVATRIAHTSGAVAVVNHIQVNKNGQAPAAVAALPHTPAVTGFPADGSRAAVANGSNTPPPPKLARAAVIAPTQ